MIFTRLTQRIFFAFHVIVTDGNQLRALIKIQHTKPVQRLAINIVIRDFTIRGFAFVV